MDRTPFRDTSCARTRVRAGVHVRRLLACTAVLASALAISTGGTQAASSNVTVTLDVLSSTTLDAAACPTAARSFGTVLPDSSVVASAPCAITFGSSNNTSMLKMYQQDLFGDAMFARTDGTTISGASLLDLLDATDPAQPYGAAISWPESPGRPARSAGALVVLRSGVPLVWFDRRSHHLVTFPATDTDTGWAETLALLVKNGRSRSVEVRKVNGEPIAPAMPWAAALQAAGFVEGYKGWSVRV